MIQSIPNQDNIKMLNIIHEFLVNQKYDLLYTSGIYDTSDNAYLKLSQFKQKQYLEIQQRLDVVQKCCLLGTILDEKHHEWANEILLKPNINIMKIDIISEHASIFNLSLERLCTNYDFIVCNKSFINKIKDIDCLEDDKLYKLSVRFVNGTLLKDFSNLLIEGYKHEFIALKKYIENTEAFVNEKYENHKSLS